MRITLFNHALWQTVKTQMKCRIMRHFMRVCTVCLDTNNRYGLLNLGHFIETLTGNHLKYKMDNYMLIVSIVLCLLPRTRPLCLVFSQSDASEGPYSAPSYIFHKQHKTLNNLYVWMKMITLNSDVR